MKQLLETQLHGVKQLQQSVDWKHGCWHWQVLLQLFVSSVWHVRTCFAPAQLTQLLLLLRFFAAGVAQ
jgi:hypothetical protein